MKIFACRGPILALLFFVTALPGLLIFATLVPFGEVADEPAQALRAQGLISGQFVGHRAPELPGSPNIGAGFDADPAMLEASLMPRGGKIMVDALTLTKSYDVRWSRTKHFLSISPLAIYAPVFYIPASAGIAIARAAGMRPYRAALFARLFNVLAYLSVGTAALLLARHGEATLLAVLLVPMSLNLAASLNEDGLIIASSALAAALISRSWAPAEPGSIISANTARALAAVTMFCICIVKPPYLPLVFIGLLPMRDIFSAGSCAGARALLWRRASPILIITICVTAWFAWTMATISEPSYFAPRPAGPLLPGVHPATFSHTDPLWQIRVLAADPFRIISLPINSFIADPLFWEMVGVLGWLDVILPQWMYNLWYDVSFIIAGGAALAIVQLTLKKQLTVSGILNSLFICLLIFAAFIAIYLSQYLVWTDVGAAHVGGPQGRYLLPLVPFLALALPELKFPPFMKANWLIPLVPLAAGLICLAEYPALLLRSYYLH